MTVLRLWVEVLILTLTVHMHWVCHLHGLGHLHSHWWELTHRLTLSLVASILTAFIRLDPASSVIHISNGHDQRLHHLLALHPDLVQHGVHTLSLHVLHVQHGTTYLDHLRCAHDVSHPPALGKGLNQGQGLLPE